MDRLLEKLIRLPLDVMISSMETMTRTMQEIQHKAETAERGKGRQSALGKAPQLAVTPLFEMYKVPTSGLASGFETLSRAVEEIRSGETEAAGTAAEGAVQEADPEIVALDEQEAAMERRVTLFGGDLASAGPALWQVGRPGRSDHDGPWSAAFDYQVGKDIDPLGAPSMPHLLTVHGGPQSAGATERLNIHFNLKRSYAAGALALVYDRWGGEKDQVHVDDTLLAPVRGAGRGRLRHVALALGELSRGDHVITLTTSGDTTDKEHRVDYLKVLSVRPSPPSDHG